MNFSIKTIKNLKLFQLFTRIVHRAGEMVSPVTTAQNEIGQNTREFAKIRDKPFIIICGCTGTGKTKLSIQLAEWLTKQNRQAEIINADAMQLYKDLDIITNKATVEEMNGIEHHLIGYLDYTCRTNTVGDYVDKAVSLIDSMLARDKIPILVGGTNYYIHSVLYDALTNGPVEENEDSNQVSCLTDIEDSELVDMILESIENEKDGGGFQEATATEDINLRSHDSRHISNQTIYEHLMKVDLECAQKLHPNDRRKMMR